MLAVRHRSPKVPRTAGEHLEILLAKLVLRRSRSTYALLQATILVLCIMTPMRYQRNAIFDSGSLSSGQTLATLSEGLAEFPSCSPVAHQETK